MRWSQGQQDGVEHEPKRGTVAAILALVDGREKDSSDLEMSLVLRRGCVRDG